MILSVSGFGDEFQMTSSFLSAVGAFAPCLCLLLALFLVAAGGSLRRANRFLAGFLLLGALDMAGWAEGLLPPPIREGMIFRLPLCFLQAPLLYGYTVALCFPTRRVRAHGWVGVATALISAGSLAPRATAWISGAAPALTAMSIHETDIVANAIALHMQYYIYIVLITRVLLGYRHACPSPCSDAENITFGWISAVVGASLFGHTVQLFKSMAWMSDQPALFQTLDRGMALIAVLVVCALTLTALLRQPLFLGVTIDPAGVDDLPTEESADADRAIVSTPDALPDPRALARLQTYMAREKPFLQPDLTIRSLARRMGMGQRELSQIINRQLRVHFFDFVNRYRIEWAVALLSHPAHEGTSILEIAHQSGFNTKSSFNAAFGKHEGTTPTALRLRLTTDPATASL